MRHIDCSMTKFFNTKHSRRFDKQKYLLDLRTKGWAAWKAPLNRTYNPISFNFTTVALVLSGTIKSWRRGARRTARSVRFTCRFFRVVVSARIDFPLSTSTCDLVSMTARSRTTKSHDDFFLLFISVVFLTLAELNHL